ncbi:MAG TPA: cytochrome c [Candidatus Sulfotelmatobacter sp.]|nr:cytochrome c [Candidatus Sulfotelmatobacter sp.]
MRTIATLFFGIFLGAAVLTLSVFFYFVSGRAPAATTAPPMPFEKQLAKMALNARIDREMPKTVPIPSDESNLAAGARIYREHCAVCHGLPGQKQTLIATGMYPLPPKLMEGKGVTDDEPGESYWKVANGIRLTGMPGFRPALSEAQIWQVSLLVAHADKLPQSARDLLAAPPALDPLATGAQPGPK